MCIRRKSVEASWLSTPDVYCNESNRNPIGMQPGMAGPTADIPKAGEGWYM